MRKSMFATGVFALAAFGAATWYVAAPILLLPSLALAGLLILLAGLLVLTGPAGRRHGWSHHAARALCLAVALPFALLTLGGCAGDLTPPQEAAALHKLYDSIAAPAAACIETAPCKAKAGDAIKAADAVAFEYVEQANKAAQAWNAAPDDDKPAAEGTFNKVLDLAKAAVAKLAALL